MGVNNLSGVATQQSTRRESNLRPLDHKSNALPLHYRARVAILKATRRRTGSQCSSLVYAMNAERRKMAADFWTKPVGLNHRPARL